MSRSARPSGMRSRLLLAVFAMATLGLVPVLTASSANAASTPVTSTGSAFNQLTPTRILDTRNGTGGTSTAVASGGTVVVPLTSAVPSGATAVSVNITAADPAAVGNLVAYPTGGTVPTSSNVNFLPMTDSANSAVVQVGTNNTITVQNNSPGATNVVVDLSGYFAPPSSVTATTAGQYFPQTPTRILDTRTNGSTLSAGGSLPLQVTGTTSNVPAGASAVVLNLTATNVTSATDYLTVYPSGGTQPMVSNLNVTANTTRAARVIVPLSSSGGVTIYNNAGKADVVVDVNGYFSGTTGTATSGSLYTPVSPYRVDDTRAGSGYPSAGKPVTTTPSSFQITGSKPLGATSGGIPSTTTTGAPTAAMLNMTEADSTGIATGFTYLTVYPGGTAPTASDLNYSATSGAVPNLTPATLASGGAVSAVVGSGSADVVVDASGYFAPTIGTTTPPAGANNISVTASPTSIANNGTSTSTITATVTSGSGSSATPVNGDALTFATSGTGCGTVSPTTATTGSSGTATTTFTSSKTAGSCTITATDATGGSGTTTVTTGATNNIAVTSSNSAIGANGSSTSTITATVTTGSGSTATPVSGDTVTFAVSGTGCGTVSPTTATTGSSGTATTTFTSSKTAGSCTITATDSTNSTGSTTTVTTYPTTTVSVTATPTTISANNGGANGTTTIMATVNGPSGAPVTGDSVGFTVSPSTCGTLSPTAANTNASGVATTTLTSGTTAGSCVVTATEGQSSATGTVTVTETSGASLTISPATASVVAGSTTGVTLTATATNFTTAGGSTAQPVNNDTVTFTATPSTGSSSSACGTLAGGGTATTNSSGQATIVYTPSSSTGVCVISAKEATNGASTTAPSYINQSSQAGTNPAITNTVTVGSGAANNNTGTVNIGGTATLTFTSTNNGTTVPNNTLQLTETPSTTGSCGTLSVNPATTNQSGVATVTYTASGTPGTCTIGAFGSLYGGNNYAGGNTPTLVITQQAGYTVTASASPTSVSGGPTSTATSTVTATIKNAAGTTPASATVTFAPASASNGCGYVSPTSVTTTNGTATTTYHAGSGTGIYCTVTATVTVPNYTGTITPATATISQTGSTQSETITTSATPSTVSGNGTATSALTATVTTGAGSPVPGDQVQAIASPSTCGTLTGSNGVPVAAGSPAFATTNNSGVASFTYTASTTAGTCTVSFTDAAQGATATQTITQNNATAVTVTPSGPGTVGSANSVGLTIAVNKGTSPVGSDTVTLTASGTCGTLANTTVTTGTNGQATTSITPAPTAGFCTVTAKEGSSGVSGTGYVDTESANPAATNVNVAASPASVVANGTATSTVTASVYFSNGNSVGAGDQVLFTLSGSGCGTVSPTVSTTGSAGTATTTYTASTTAGSCSVTAREANDGSATPGAGGAGAAPAGTNPATITQTAAPVTVSVSASPQQLSLSGTSTSTITVSATQNGASDVGDSFTLTALNPQGTATGCGTFSTNPVTTGTNGSVTSKYTEPANGANVTCTITATDAAGNTASTQVAQSS